MHAPRPVVAVAHAYAPRAHNTECCLHMVYFVLVCMEGNVLMSIVTGALCLHTIYALFFMETAE